MHTIPPSQIENLSIFFTEINVRLIMNFVINCKYFVDHTLKITWIV